MKMHYFQLTVLVLSAVLLSVKALDKEFLDKFIEELQAVGEKCVPEVGATEDDIAELINHKIPSTHTGQCLVFCFHKHFHLLTPEGQLDPVGALKSLEPLKEHDSELYEKVKIVFTNCGTSAKIYDDPCQTAAALGQCGYDEGKKLGLSESLLEL